MQFETVQFFFFGGWGAGGGGSVRCHPEILLPWLRDVSTSPYSRIK